MPQVAVLATKIVLVPPVGTPTPWTRLARSCELRLKCPPMIYLDHNATTPVLPEVFEAMRPCFCQE
jgi:hypothetical protein